MVQMVKLSKHTNDNLTYKNHFCSPRQPFTTKPAIIELTPIDKPIHGMYANPAEWYKKPTKSPKKQATKPNNGPITIPVNMDKNKVNENCVSANLNSKNIFDTTQKAVNTAMYAIRWLSFFPCIVSDNNHFSHAFVSIFDIIKTSRLERSATVPYTPFFYFNAYLGTSFV